MLTEVAMAKEAPLAAQEPQMQLAFWEVAASSRGPGCDRREGGGIFTLGKKVPSLGGFTITDNVGGDCRGNSTQPASTATTDKDGSCVEK